MHSIFGYVELGYNRIHIVGKFLYTLLIAEAEMLVDTTKNFTWKIN